MATKCIMLSLEKLFKNAGDKDRDFMRDTQTLISKKLMDAEVTAKIGAEKYQRTDDRNNQRKGSRTRHYDTRLGSIYLQIPKLRQASYFPSFLEPRRMWGKALVNVVQEAYVHGVSTQKVDELVQAQSTVSRMSQKLDELLQRFVQRPLTVQYPYLWLDATFPKVRERGHVENMAMAVAVGVNENGDEILGFDISMSENGPF